MEYILIFITAIFVNNIVLSQFLGIVHSSVYPRKLRQLRVWERLLHSCLPSLPLLPILSRNSCSMLRVGIFADHCIYPCHCSIGTDGGNHFEEGNPPALYQALGVFLPLITN